MRTVAAAVVLAGLAGCQTAKGPSESGLPVYYSTQHDTTVGWTLYPQPQ